MNAVQYYILFQLLKIKDNFLMLKRQKMSTDVWPQDHVTQLDLWYMGKKKKLNKYKKLRSEMAGSKGGKAVL